MKIGGTHACTQKNGKMKKSGSGNLKSFFAFLVGILIASCGLLLPEIFFSNEDEMLLGRQSTVSVLSSDSVHTVTRNTSFTLEDYAYITEMTKYGSRYYSEPTEAQLSMREASNAAGEILKALLPNVFTQDVHQPYTLSSAILTSNVQSSEEEYDYRQSFWYVDISYPEDINDLTVSSTINAVNGKAWTVVAEFPIDSAAYDSYGIRVVENFAEIWGIASNLFFSDLPVTVGENQQKLFAVSTESAEAQVSDEKFYAEYVTDTGVLVHNASDYFERLETAVQTLDGLANLMDYLYTNYLEYLGITEETAGQIFSVEILFEDDVWYSIILDNCRQLALLRYDKQLLEDETENNGFMEMYGMNEVDTILLNSELYAETLTLLSLMEYPYALDVFLTATDETSGLQVTVGLQICCNEAFVLSVSLGLER